MKSKLFYWSPFITWMRWQSNIQKKKNKNKTWLQQIHKTAVREEFQSAEIICVTFGACLAAPCLCQKTAASFMLSSWFSPFRKCKTIFAGFIGLEDRNRLENLHTGGDEFKTQNLQLRCLWGACAPWSQPTGWHQTEENHRVHHAPLWGDGEKVGWSLITWWRLLGLDWKRVFWESLCQSIDGGRGTAQGVGGSGDQQGDQGCFIRSNVKLSRVPGVWQGWRAVLGRHEGGHPDSQPLGTQGVSWLCKIKVQLSSLEIFRFLIKFSGDVARAMELIQLINYISSGYLRLTRTRQSIELWMWPGI